MSVVFYVVVIFCEERIYIERVRIDRKWPSRRVYARLSVPVNMVIDL